MLDDALGIVKYKMSSMMSVSIAPSFEDFNIKVVQQEEDGGNYDDSPKNVSKHVARSENELFAERTAVGCMADPFAAPRTISLVSGFHKQYLKNVLTSVITRAVSIASLNWVFVPRILDDRSSIQGALTAS